MSQRPTIECRPDGPYIVRDLTDFRNSRGEAIPTQPVLALCRCGGSANKPLCDGTHKKIGFSGAKAPDATPDRLDAYRGRGITIYDNRGICAHAGQCTARLASVFKYGSEPWIDPEGAPVEAIIATVRACPSGALSYALDGGEEAQAPRQPAILITKDGPYAVVGGIELIGQSWSQGASPEHYTLCRCGASKNKPFCDGSHWRIGFKDEKG